MNTLIYELLSQALIFGGLFFLIALVACFLDKKIDRSKFIKRPLFVRDVRVIEQPTREEIITSINDGTAITTHGI